MTHHIARMPTLFGETIKAARVAQSITATRLSDICGVHRCYISLIENGKSPPPSYDLTIKLALELGLNADYLLALTGRVMPDIIDAIIKHPTEIPYLIRLKGREYDSH